MAPTQDYYNWVNAGRHWDNARTVNALATTFRNLGYTVYTLGDESHLTANPPEDHTPFSHTGWPVTTRKGTVSALDIMPRSGLPGLSQIGHAIIAAKEAGLPAAAPIKYINWTDENGNVQHTSWEPNESQVHSSDSGHIHISVRSDMLDSAACDGWNPLSGAVLVSDPKPSGLDVDGQLGPKTITRWQQIMGTPVDGVISQPVSDLVKAVQRKLNSAIGAGLVVDGGGIVQDNHAYHTVKALQQYLGTTQDSRLSVPVSECVKALQRRLNGGSF